MEQGILCFQIMAKSLAPLTGTTTPFPSVGLWNKFWSCLCMRAVRVIGVCLRPLVAQLVKTNIWTSVSFLATEKASRTMYRRKESMATCITYSNNVGQCESVAGAGLQLTIIPLLKTFTRSFLIYRGRGGMMCACSRVFENGSPFSMNVFIYTGNTLPFLHSRYKHPLEWSSPNKEKNRISNPICISVNCAEYFGGGGWWYAGCSAINPTGPLTSRTRPAMHWVIYEPSPQFVRLSKLVLKIQPYDFNF